MRSIHKDFILLNVKGMTSNQRVMCILSTCAYKIALDCVDEAESAIRRAIIRGWKLRNWTPSNRDLEAKDSKYQLLLQRLDVILKSQQILRRKVLHA